MENVQQIVGKRVKTLRNAKGWSQLKLSTESGLDPSWIGQVERGVVVPTVKTLDQICKGLSITLAEFFNPTRLKAREDDFLVREIIQTTKRKSIKAKRLIRDFAKAVR